MPPQEHQQAAVPKNHWCPGRAHQQTFTYLQDVASVCKSFKVVPLLQPADLSEDDYKKMGKKMIWEASMKTYMKQVNLLEGNTRAI
jgi:hypothetical protein